MSNPILLIQGGQYGSEAKGAVAAYLTNRRKVDIVVRTGATNAGHTCYFNDEEVKLQQLPVGFVRPDTMLVLGAGSLIDPEILDREVALLTRLTGRDIRDRLLVDRRAGLHVASHAARSRASGRHHAIGATGKGCSEALIDRIRNRGTESAMLFGDSPYARDYHVCDTESYLNYKWNEGARILLEGTQGQLLDLYLGPYPYTTHKQTGPAQWMLEAGLSPALPTEIVMVVRTFPIRVAGNSGPLPRETSWPYLARYINHTLQDHHLAPLVGEEALKTFEAAVRFCSRDFPLPDGSDGLDQYEWDAGQRKTYQAALSELHRAALNYVSDTVRAELKRLFEMTTVTKKLRRVAFLDRESLEVASRQARPHWVALTFINYVFPQHWFKAPRMLNEEEQGFIRSVEEMCNAPVGLLGFGPRDEHFVYSGMGG